MHAKGRQPNYIIHIAFDITWEFYCTILHAYMLGLATPYVLCCSVIVGQRSDIDDSFIVLADASLAATLDCRAFATVWAGRRRFRGCWRSEQKESKVEGANSCNEEDADIRHLDPCAMYYWTHRECAELEPRPLHRSSVQYWRTTISIYDTNTDVHNHRYHCIHTAIIQLANAYSFVRTLT